jgi:hypothetical protein
LRTVNSCKYGVVSLRQQDAGEGIEAVAAWTAEELGRFHAAFAPRYYRAVRAVQEESTE